MPGSVATDWNHSLGSRDDSWMLQPEDVAVGEYARRAHAASLTWDEHVRGLLPIYDEVLDAGTATCRDDVEK